MTLNCFRWCLNCVQRLIKVNKASTKNGRIVSGASLDCSYLKFIYVILISHVTPFPRWPHLVFISNQTITIFFTKKETMAAINRRWSQSTPLTLRTLGSLSFQTKFLWFWLCQPNCCRHLGCLRRAGGCGGSGDSHKWGEGARQHERRGCAHVAWVHRWYGAAHATMMVKS